MIKIGDVDIIAPAGYNMQIGFPTISPKRILRTKNGTGILTSRWKKKGINISGTGFIPDGLDAIDENVLTDIHLTNFLSVLSSSNVITIPRAFRTDDYAPQGLAVINEETTVESPVTINVQQATVTIVPNATHYKVIYCPIISGYIQLIDRTFDDQNNIWNWVIVAEQA